MDISRLQTAADSLGLVVRGGFAVEKEDRVPDIAAQQPARFLLLFGNAGSSLWTVFSDSPEYRDRQPDSLDRWSKRVGTAIAGKLGGLALFPFGGPPYQPFIPWASKAESLLNSKLGMLMHPDYGLWHAYRFAIALPFDVWGTERNQGAEDICASCVDQPCLSACPVDAFSDRGYDVKACYAYLAQDARSACRSHTCQARKACPVGTQFQYQKRHGRFHMDAFYDSVDRRFSGEDS